MTRYGAHADMVRAYADLRGYVPLSGHWDDYEWDGLADWDDSSWAEHLAGARAATERADESLRRWRESEAEV